MIISIFLVAGKFICLFVGLRYTFINAAKAIFKHGINSSNFVYQSLGISGFIILQWCI